ncbi:hypothetical protein GT028_23865, partial [Streptomyces sp. SID2999]|nr:hypothetical protein [Streptomyces sp. SID2999]
DAPAGPSGGAADEAVTEVAVAESEAGTEEGEAERPTPKDLARKAASK